MNVMNTAVSVNNQKLLLSLVSVGNPHAVHFIEYPVNDFPLVDIGAK